MKKLLLWTGIAATMFMACSDDNDKGEDSNQGNLLKKWYRVSDEVEGEIHPYFGHQVCGADYLEFLENDVVKYHDVSACVGDLPQQDTDIAEWTIDGDEITISFSPTQTFNATVLHLTETELHLQIIYDYDEDGDDEVVIEHYQSYLST